MLTGLISVLLSAATALAVSLYSTKVNREQMAEQARRRDAEKAAVRLC